MSTLVADEFYGKRQNNRCIVGGEDTYLISNGRIIQTLFARFGDPIRSDDSAVDDTSVYRSGQSFSPIPNTRISIAPILSNSTIVIQWWLFYEGHWNQIFAPMRYNEQTREKIQISIPKNLKQSAPTQRYGLAAGHYDNDQDTTPYYQNMKYIDQNLDNNYSYYYQLERFSTAYSEYSNYIAVNRVYNTTTMDSNARERGKSFVMIQEISPNERYLE